MLYVGYTNAINKVLIPNSLTTFVKVKKFIYLFIVVIGFSSCDLSERLWGHSFVQDLEAASQSNPVTVITPIPLQPIDLTTPLFEDDFNRSDQLLTSNIKWSSLPGFPSAEMINNQELSTVINGGSFVVIPNIPDLDKIYFENSIKLGSGSQLYAILPYSNLNTTEIMGCYFEVNAGVFNVYAGDYLAYAANALVPLLSLNSYSVSTTTYVGCEVDQASGTAKAFLNSIEVGKVENLTIPAASNSIPLFLGEGSDIVMDNVKGFSSFLAGRTPNDGDLRIYNTPYTAYYTAELANVVLQGYCANNGATIQVKDAAPNTFQSAIVNCVNNHFAVTLNLSNPARFTVGANQIRIEYVNAGNTTEYFWNFLNLGTAVVPPLLSGPTPASGNQTTEFVWTVTYPVGAVVSLTPALVSVSGDSTNCVSTVESVTATTYRVKLNGCSVGSGSVGIKILAGSAQNEANTSFPESADSSTVSILNFVPEFTLSSIATPTSGTENTTFRWTLDYSYATNIVLATSHVQVLGTNSGCTSNVVDHLTLPNIKHIDVTNCAGNGSIGLRVLAGSATNLNGSSIEQSTAVNVLIVNPIEVNFTRSNDSVFEGNTLNSQQMYISLSRASDVAIEISYSVAPEFTTAINPTNFNLLNHGTITIPAGQTTWPIDYNYNGDLVGLGIKKIQVVIDGIVTSISNIFIGKKQILQRLVIDEENFDGFSQISAGEYHTCGLTASGSAKCWGFNGSGQLGGGAIPDSATPVVVSGGGSYTMIAAGKNHTCAITASGSAKCWGFNFYGQLGVGNHSNSSVPVTVSGADTFKMISSGSDHTCGITSADIVKCWGGNGSGQLGDGTTTLSNVPIAINDADTYKIISSGGNHTCGITSADIVKCWGYNGFGQLGDGSTAFRFVPTTISDVDTYKQISAGSKHTCGINSADRVKCWGDNGIGQLGDGTNNPRVLPTFLNDGVSYIDISAGSSQSCGVTLTNVAKCWGYNGSGQLGDGTTAHRNTATVINDSESYIKITVKGGNHTCGLTLAGITKCWGHGGYGQLGILKIPQKLEPATISSSETQMMISAGQNHTCGIASGGIAKCWGGNNNNQLGNVVTFSYRSAPTPVGDNDIYTTISAGVYHTCGVTFVGIVKCWGDNSYGQLGNGTMAGLQDLPTAIVDLDTYTSVSAGTYYTCGLTIAGSVKCWGSSSVLPVAIVSGGDVYTAVSAGQSFGCGLTSTGIIKCWGHNSYGQLGNGTNTYGGTAQPVSGGDTYITLSAGRDQACALTIGNVIKCWGFNGFGQLGDGTTISKNVPTAIMDVDTYTSVSTGFASVCGITSTGIVKCWGHNLRGQLGDGTVIDRSVPQSVSGVDTFTKITVGADHACAVTGTGLIKCWGSNDSNALGLGEESSTTSPIPIVQ